MLHIVPCPIQLTEQLTCVFAVDEGTTDDVGVEFLNGQYSNSYLVDVLQTFTDPGDRVLDLGAHLGSFAIPAAMFGRHVLAVDANEKHVTLLKECQRLNNLKNLEIVHAAVGDREGTIEFIEEGLYGRIAPTGSDTSHLMTSHVKSVPMRPASALLQERGWGSIQLLKIDIEGSEPLAFAGLESVLRRDDAPAIWYESNSVQLEHFGRKPQELHRRLADYGYTNYRILGNRFYPTEVDDFQIEAWADMAALKPSHLSRIPDRLEPAMSLDQLATLMRDWYVKSPAVLYRLYLAKHLEFAKPSYLQHPITQESLAMLSQDSDTAVREGVRWWSPTRIAA
jgi:FkbM family methyltransferase